MSSSLDKLVSNLPKEAFKYTPEEFTGKKLSIMSQKVVSFKKFDQTELPAKEQFYSVLNDQHITNNEYNHAKKFGRPSTLRQWVNIMTYTLINKTNDLILNLTPENVTQHSRIVTTTCKGSSTPTKMSKIIGRQIQ